MRCHSSIPEDQQGPPHLGKKTYRGVFCTGKSESPGLTLGHALLRCHVARCESIAAQCPGAARLGHAPMLRPALGERDSGVHVGVIVKGEGVGTAADLIVVVGAVDVALVVGEEGGVAGGTADGKVTVAF
jgi:hypothetical protein